MKKRIILMSTVLVIIAITLGGVFYIYKNILNIDTIYKGVTIENIDVSGKTMEQALEYIKDIKTNEIKKKSMKLIYGEKAFKIPLTDLGFSYDYEKAVEYAMQLGREGNFLKRLKDIAKIKSGYNVPLESYYSVEMAETIVNAISQEINTNAKNAEAKIVNGKINISDHVIGKRVLQEELLNLMDENINKLEDITIPVEDVTPLVTKDMLLRINGIIGEYSTSFKGSSKNRIENIKLSANAINNKLVLPGEEFSYNKATGPRTAEYGYKEANVIIGGELTPDVGGGVCQTSTTLYNALLLADLTITERHHHSIPVSYVPIGQDAAVAYGYLDLKFKNSFDFPVLLHTKVSGDRLYVYVYGDRNSKDYTVKITSQIVETIKPQTKTIFDSSLNPGESIVLQSGRTGYRVVTYKSIIKDGKTISKKQITSDHYKKKDYIYKVGPE
ncbi:MAG TPA: VanW family protein [Tissierellaceae bacterium]